jgi:hypothetical protein
VASLDLKFSRKIPDDAALVVVASPQQRLQVFEESLLRDYLSTRAGHVILMLDPRTDPGLENLLYNWGIRVLDNVIFDTNPRSLTENFEFIFERFLPHPITQPLINHGLYIMVGPTRAVIEDVSRAPDDGLSVTRLVASYPTAWGETDYRNISRDRPPAFTRGADLQGPDGLGVLVVSERLKPAALQFSVPGGRLAVFGTADMITNNRLINNGNLYLFLNTLNWAINPDTMQIDIPPRPIERFQLSLSQEELGRLRLGLLFVVPGAVAMLGLIVYWTRRN